MGEGQRNEFSFDKEMRNGVKGEQRCFGLMHTTKEVCMPIIQVDGPPLEIEQKRALAKRMTDVAMDIYKIPHITVIIKENAPENVASNGELIADKHHNNK